MPTSKSVLETASFDSFLSAPSFEMLESRLLLSAPTFATALSQGYTVPVPTDSSTYNTRVIGINGSSDTTSVTASVDGGPVAGLTVTVQNGVTYNYADIHFVASDGVTPIGDIVFQLYDSQNAWLDSAAAAQRFEDLATQGVTDGALDPNATPFYTNVLVHRVIPGFMIQTGDATNGNGTGGSGLAKLTDSFDPNLNFVGAGVVALANTGAPNSSDCQFFITAAPYSYGNGNYMIIGQVVSGWDVLNTIINSPRGANDRPTNPPKMQSVSIFQSVSDATVTLTTDSTFTGSANVTISLTNADGTTDKTIEVIPDGTIPTRITSTPIPQQTLAPGASKQVQAQFTDIAGLPMTFTATSSQAGTTATIDPVTQMVTVTAPNTYSGPFTVTLTAADGFWADEVPVTQTFNVLSQNTGGPTLDTPLSQGYWVPVPTNSSTYNTRVIGIDGSSDTTSVTATVGPNSDGSAVTGLTVTVQNGTAYNYADIHFVASNGTPIGDIVFQLFDGQNAWADAATAAQRFENLATEAVKSGKLKPSVKPFYTNVPVHRVIPGFMIQTGDATKGNGTGSSGLGNLTDVFDPNLSFVGAGVVAMANTGAANSSDCQFFITDAPTNGLNGKYMIIGQVVSGWDVLNQIINLPTGLNPATNTYDMPINPPIMKSVHIFQSVSDATVTLKTDSTFTGSANVTVTLTDANGHKTDKTIKVVPEGSIPNPITGTPPAQQKIASGASKTIQGQFIDTAGLPMTFTTSSSQTTVTATIDPVTQQITVAVPGTVTGIFTVSVTANEVGGFWADLPVTATFDVVSQNSYDPQLQSNTADSSGGTVYKTVAYGGHYVVEAAGYSGVIVYDVTNPDSPIKVGSYNTQDSARDVVVVGQTAYVADTYGGVVALNITDPTNITLIDSVGLLESDGSTSAPAVNLIIDPNTNIAYVAAYDAGLIEVDVSNPASMSVLRTVKQLSSTFGITDAVDVVLKDTYAFVADAAGGVIVLNIADPANVSSVTAFRTVSNPWGLDIVGNTLYVADQYLIAYNVANPAQPMLAGYLQLASAWQVSVVNGMALVGNNSGGLSLVDVTNPAKMTLVYNFASTGFVGSSTVVGANNIAVAGGSDGLLMLSGTRSVNNQSVTLLDDNGVPVTVTVTGGSATIATTGFNAGNITLLNLVASSPKTTVTITTPSGKTTTVSDIMDSVGSLKSLVAKTTDVSGEIVVMGSLETLTVHDMTGASERTITIEGDSSVAVNSKAVLVATMHNVTDLLLNSQVPIKSLTVNNWTDTGSDDQIYTLSLGKLTVSQNLEATVKLTGQNNLPQTLGTVNIGGGVDGYDWQVAGKVGKVTLGNVSNWGIGGYTDPNNALVPLVSIASLTVGDVSNVTIDATGYLGAIKARSWTGGNINAGGATSITTTAGNLNTGMTLSGAGVSAKSKTLGSVKSAAAIDGTWSVTGATGALSAVSIPSTWNGTFSGNVKSLSVSQDASGQLEAGSITSMTVKGKYGDGVSGDTTLKLTQPLGGAKAALGSLSVTGLMDNVDVISLDKLGTITAGGMTGSNVYSGVLDVDDALASIDSIDSSVLSPAGIAGVTIKGIKGDAGPFFVDSNLVGWNMGTLKLNTIQTDNGGNGTFGVAANSIKSYTAQIGAKPYTWTPKAGLWPNDTSADNGDYEVLQAV